MGLSISKPDSHALASRPSSRRGSQASARRLSSRRDSRAAARRPSTHDSDDPVYLDAQGLHRAFTYMAYYLQKERRSIVLVAIGGVTHVLLLGTEPAAMVASLFNHHLDSNQIQHISWAATYARRKMRQHHRTTLPVLWSHSATIRAVCNNLPSIVTEEALVRNEVLFSAPGLRIVAAPWSFAIVAKANRIDRMHDSDSGTRLVRDTVTYLRRYLKVNRVHSIRTRKPVEWSSRYGQPINQAAVRAIDQAYRRKYGEHGLH